MSSTPKFFDRVMSTSTTTGTGTYTLGSAVTGYQAWSVLGDGNSAYYAAQEVDGNGNPSGGWEVGLGTYTASGTTLSRDTILASSNSNAAVNWSAGTRRIFLTMPAAVSVPQVNPALGPLLLGAKFITGLFGNISTGDTDLYTVPTGKRAIVTTMCGFNPSAGSITWYPKVKISGTYYRLNSGSAAGAGTFSAPTSVSFILEAGEILAINTITTNGLNVSTSIIEFDAASPLKTVKLAGLSTGDNTLYTCPSGKTALPLGPSLLFGGINPTVFCPFLYVVGDASGGDTFVLHLVPSGGSAGSTNKIATVTPSANARGTASFAGSLGAGDFIVVNASTGDAAQIAWMNLVEL